MRLMRKRQFTSDIDEQTATVIVIEPFDACSRR